MLSIDRNILSAGSDAFLRMRSYGGVVQELHIIVFSLQKIEKLEIAENIFAYSTCSLFRFFYLFDAYKIACEILAKKNASEWLITSQDAFTHPLGVWLRGKFIIALEVQIHTDFMSPYFRRESLLNFARYHIYAWAIRRADVIRAVSERVWNSLKSKSNTFKARIYVLPIFIDISRIAKAEKGFIRARYPHYNFYILMAGRLSREKRIEDALAAFALVLGRYVGKSPLLLILGNGSEKKNIECAMGELGLTENVKIEEPIGAEQLAAYYKDADIFLLSSAYEGYGRTIIEAVAAKTPVIMTDVGVAGEVISNAVTGVIVPVGDIEAMAEAIFDASQRYEKFQTYAVSAYELLMKYAPDEKTYLEKIRRVWDEVHYVGK
ncbi:MAG: glycosyltransferase [Patescibacteria group bacterium]